MKKQEKPRKRRWYRIPLQIIKYVLFLFTLAVMVFTIVSATSFNKETGGGLFGYKFFVILSDSMKLDFHAGDVAVVKAVPTSSLSEGDIITFQSIDPANYGEFVTHKIKAKTIYEGEEAFVTYGTATGSEDATPALAEKVIGQYQFAVPKAGYVFQMLKSPIGYFGLIFFPFMLLILLEGIRFFRSIKQYQREKQEEIDRQKAEIELERRKTQEILAEVEALRRMMWQ